jgi:hypothetical protein
VAGQALPRRPQRPARPQVRPGPGVRPRRRQERLLPRRPAGEPDADGNKAYDGPLHFDYKPYRTTTRRTCGTPCAPTWSPT